MKAPLLLHHLMSKKQKTTVSKAGTNNSVKFNILFLESIESPLSRSVMFSMLKNRLPKRPLSGYRSTHIFLFSKIYPRAAECDRSAGKKIYENRKAKFIKGDVLIFSKTEAKKSS